MPRIHPLHLFPPQIAERSLLYFQQGKVRDVQKTSAGRYRAEVCGSENYSVWLKQAVGWIQPRACLWAHTLPAIPQNPYVGCVRYARTRSLRNILSNQTKGRLKAFPNFQTAFLYSYFCLFFQTCNQFIGQVQISLGTFGVGVVGEGGEAVAGGFGEADVAGDDGVEE